MKVFGKRFSLPTSLTTATERHGYVVPLVELVLVVVFIGNGLACVWPSDKVNAVCTKGTSWMMFFISLIAVMGIFAFFIGKR